MEEEKQIEQAEREEESATATEYEKPFFRLFINELQKAAFDQETNIEQAKNKEKELEEKRKAKAEKLQRKKS